MRHERQRQPFATAATEGNAAASEKQQKEQAKYAQSRAGMLAYFDIEEDPEKLNIPGWQEIVEDDPFEDTHPENANAPSVASDL